MFRRLRRLLIEVLFTVPCILSAHERVMVQADRSLYAAGETIWMRGWICDSGSSRPVSRYLYAELLRDGQGSVEQRIKLKESDGIFSGQIVIPEDVESGWYTLRAYTRAQTGWPAESLFHTRILIRGFGPLPSVYHSVPPETSDAQEIRVELLQSDAGKFSVRLTDASGSPVAGDFSLSVVDAVYEDFDSYAVPFTGQSAGGDFSEGPREYAQELAFHVRSSRKRMPDRYGVSIMSRDIGFYLSTDVEGDRSVDGAEGQAFLIPDLDFEAGTVFTVNVSGAKYIFPAGDEELFAPPYDYGPSYNIHEEISDTSQVRLNIDAAVPPIHSDDTLSAGEVTAGLKPSAYRPDRVVGPYSSVFEWRQVRLREELRKYDDMDLMTYISVTWPGLVCLGGTGGFAGSRTMYTPRSGSVSQTLTASHGEMPRYSVKASYDPVDLYINGMKMDSWSEVSMLTVRSVENIYVLRGAEAALYKAAAVVLIEMGKADHKRLGHEASGERRFTTGLMPLGWVWPKKFPQTENGYHERRGTYYWNPGIRTDASGIAEITIPGISGQGCYFRLAGQTSDGRYFSFSCKQ